MVDLAWEEWAAEAVVEGWKEVPSAARARATTERVVARRAMAYVGLAAEVWKMVARVTVG